MKVYDDKSWSQTTLGEWKSKYPSSLVLERDQDFERPTNWPKFDIQSAKKLVNAGDSVAPRWGENTEK
jgi:hypothetical protein